MASFQKEMGNDRHVSVPVRFEKQFLERFCGYLENLWKGLSSALIFIQTLLCLTRKLHAASKSLTIGEKK